MAGHIHADLMMQYAEDAKIHAEPRKLWQFRYSATGEWRDFRGFSPTWEEEVEYRRKPNPKQKMWQWLVQRSNGAIFLTPKFYATVDDARKEYSIGYSSIIIGPAPWTEIEV